MPNFLYETVVAGETFTVSVAADSPEEGAELARNEFEPAFGDVNVTLVSSDAPSAPATPPAPPVAPTPDPAPAPAPPPAP